MAGLSDNVNTNALQRNTPNPCGDSLAGYHIYSWSERHRNRVFPAFLSYQSQPRFLPPTPPPRRYPNERSRLLLEGLRNNGHFVLNGILIDLEDDRRAEEARAQEALEAEHATFHRKDEENKSAAARPALIEPKEQTGIENPANSGQQIRVARQTEPEDQAEVEKQIEPEHLAQPELSIEPKQQTEAGQQTQAEPSEAEQQTEPKQLSQPERPTESEQHTEAQQQIGAENQVETDQSRQRAPSFDPEFDGDRGIFSDPLAEFDGANPFTDFDGDHTHLHVEIDYGEDRGNLSESDNDDDSESERGSDRKTEEDPSSEDEFDGTDPFADFDGDHTHFHVPFDFEEDSSKAASEEISELNLELGRAPESEQDANLEPVQVSEDDPEQDHDIENQGVNMDSIDEILAAANSVDYTPEDEDEDEDMGDDVDLDYEDGEDIGDEDEHDMDAMPSAPFNPIAMGLKEIGGLAHFRVSSYKPGNGVDELKNDDTDRYWQYVFSMKSVLPCQSPANSCTPQVRRRAAPPPDHGFRQGGRDPRPALLRRLHSRRILHTHQDHLEGRHL